MQAWIAGTMPEAEADLVRTHLDRCETCSELIVAVAVTRRIGQCVGRYEIIELVGGGAMGEVYRATDPDLGRDVAIKLVRPGGSQKRLLREAQAMAQLTHPHVMRIYDVGTVGHDVFLAMELVQGVTLRAHFARTRAWRDVVGTLRQAGSGLRAAHEAGLTHGDFKPDNILVANDGRVLVTDFGLVREHADDRASATSTATFAGTPAYMAPEQFEAPVATTQSDQFAFCVTLFEGLYGHRPFAGDNVAGLRVSLAKPVAIPRARGVPARIVRALQRGLSPAPGDRFPSMAALLAALDTSSGRAKWIALGLAAAGAAVATTLFVTRAERDPCALGANELAGVWDETSRRDVTRAFEASKLAYAPTSLATVTGQLDRYREHWIAAYGSTCKAVQSAQLLDTRMTCLRRRRDEAKAVVSQLASGRVRDAVTAVAALRPISDCEDVESLQDIATPPPAVREQVVALDAEVARCRALLSAGEVRPAHECATTAAKRAHELAYEPSIAEAETIAGTASTRLRTWPEAESALTRALLAAEAGRDPRGRARALIYLVSVAAERATFEQGHKSDDHAAAIIKALGNDGGLAAELAYHRGNLLLREGKLAPAEAALKQALAAREQLYGPGDARIAEPLGILAVVHLTRKEYAQSRQLLARVMQIQEAALGPSHPNTGRTLHTVAQVEARAGKLEDALAAQQRSYEILTAAYGEEHRDVALSVGMAAQAHLMAGKYDAAIPYAVRSVELMEKATSPDSPDLAVALQTLAATYSRAGKTADALAVHQRTLAILLKSVGPKHPQTTQSQVNVAMALRTHGRCGEALPLLAAALETRVGLLGEKHVDVGRVLQTTGDCYVDLGRAAEAVAPLERSLAIRAASPAITADDKVALAHAKYGLARALWDANGDRKRAAQLVRDGYAELTALADKRADGLREWATKRGVTL
ncbi:MAG: tetratricopeptide repeat protein [Myxococcota bacterium]|nr:tetratricopeptide repeat protein [Myxococcota bacterium]